ncbi:MAG: hypothetical protein ACP5JE_04830, partial [Thermoplasmata archaeon]
IQTKKLKLLPVFVPLVNRTNAFLIKGNYYYPTQQLRRKPGVYIFPSPEQYSAYLNFQKGGRYKIYLDDDRFFKIVFGNRQFFLYPILKTFGISDDELIKAWGKDLFDINKTAPDSTAKFLEYITSKSIPESDVQKELLREFSTFVMPGYKSGDPKLFIDTTKRLISTLNGETQPDSKNDIRAKSIHSIEDFIKERFSAAKEKLRLQGKLRSKLNRHDDIREIVTPDILAKSVTNLFTTMDLINPETQTNPIKMHESLIRTTLTGTGGIQTSYALTEDDRNVHTTHVGFLDPVHTPEGENIGVVNYLTPYTFKHNNQLYTYVYDIKNNKYLIKTPEELYNSYVTTQHDYEKAKDKVPGLYDGKLTTFDKTKVQYILHPFNFFSLSTLLLPFLNSTSAPRAMAAAKMQAQAIPLEDPDVPLIGTHVKIYDKKYDVSELIASSILHHAPEDVKVTAVEKNKLGIFVKAKGIQSGKSYTFDLPNHVPLNQSFITSNFEDFNSERLFPKVGDIIKKGQPIADNQFTKNGKLALGKNLKVAYLPFKNLNYEDAIVISESAAKKLTSVHVEVFKFEKNKNTILDKNLYLYNFGTGLNKDNIDALDSEGIIKENSVVHYNDILIAAMEPYVSSPETAFLKSLGHKVLPKYVDRAVRWPYEFSGKVHLVSKNPHLVTVEIFYKAPAQVGDKLVGRSGNKGIIGDIVPDHQMPHDSKNEPVDIVLNPIGIISRMNPSQILETALGKISKHYSLDPFSENNIDFVKSELAKHKISDVEPLTVEGVGKTKGLVGNQYFYKLEHVATAKESARYRGAYDIDLVPKKGGSEQQQSKSMDLLTLYALLSHGAINNISEMAKYKAFRNNEFWDAVEHNLPIPPVKDTFGWNKFVSLLRAAGIDIKQNGTNLTLVPITDKQINQYAQNRVIQDPVFIRQNDLSEKKGGLFDPVLTGGLKGDKWSKIELPYKIPSPIAEKAIREILDLTQKQYDDIISHKLTIDGLTGSKYFEHALNFKLEDKISQVSKQLENKNLAPSVRDKLLKKLKYLKGMQQAGIEPSDLLIKYVPVVPPVMRPIYPLPNGKLETSPLNYLYKDIGLAANTLKQLKDLPDDVKHEEYLHLYKSVKALNGLTDPVSPYYGMNTPRGALDIIAGDSPDTGFFQAKLVNKNQDLVGRSVIRPGPNLEIDQIGIPVDIAFKIFQPFIISYLEKSGISAVDIKKAIATKSDLALKALNEVMKERLVLANRAPSLHRYSIMAFKPVLVPGKALQLNPHVVTGFNADFDGDAMTIHVPVTRDALQEAHMM